jgi:rod shape determining protein RodA
MFSAKLWRHFDFALMGAVLVLMVFGVAMVRSTTLSSIDPVVREQANRQAIFAAIGLVIVLIVSAVDYRVYGSLARLIYVTLIVLLLIVEIIGIATFGAQRWIDLGIINLQPAELGKFLITITLAYYVAESQERIKTFNFVLRTLIHLGIPVLLIAIQPDFSSVLIYLVLWFAIVWSAGLKLSHVGLLGAIAVPVLVAGFLFALSNQEYRYIANRVIQFAIPEDPGEAAYLTADYNVQQSLISLGAGGWFGEGYASGSQVQLRFLKVRQTDFIFAAIGNEFGFIGTVAITLIIAFIVFRIYRIGQTARDPFGRMICFGVGTILFFESFANIASNLDLIPVSGSPLPFVSYGGSSLFTYMIGIGLVQSVIMRHRQIEF